MYRRAFFFLFSCFLFVRYPSRLHFAFCFYNTNIHALGEIRIHKPSRRAATDLRPRPLGHWARLRTPDRPARNESLHRLSYPGPYITRRTKQHFKASLRRGFIYGIHDYSTRTLHSVIKSSTSWFLKLWYAYHYWYANYCSLVCDLSTVSKYRTAGLKKEEIKHEQPKFAESSITGNTEKVIAV